MTSAFRPVARAVAFLAAVGIGAVLSAATPDSAAEVRAVLDAQVAAWNHGDLEGYMAGYWRSSELEFYSGATITRGWQQTLERYRKRYPGEGHEMGTLSFSNVRVDIVAPDAAVVSGEWRLDTKSGHEAATGTAPTSAPATPSDDHPLERAASAVDNALGYRLPRPWDPDIADKLKSEEGLRSIAFEMGDKNPSATAHQAWRQLQAGKAAPEAVAQRVANFRLQKIESESIRLQETLSRQKTVLLAMQRQQTNEAVLPHTQTEKPPLHGLFTLIVRKFTEGWRIVHDHSS